MLLECMIFYGKVSVIANHSILKQLIFTFGFETINELLDRGILEVIYTETQTGVLSTPNGKGINVYDTAIFSSPQHTFHRELVKYCHEFAQKEGKGRRNALRLEKKIVVSNHEESVAGSARQIILDNDFLSDAVPTLIKFAIPSLLEIPEGIIFKSEEIEKGIIIHSNLNFETLNRMYHKHVSPERSNLTPALILSKIFEIECDLYFASRQLSEIVTSTESSILIGKRFNYLVDRCTKSQTHKDTFQDFVFEQNRTIRESYNRGEIPLPDILKVIFRAEEFKKWLAGKDINADLLKEYYKEVTKETIIDKLPTKYIRWAMFTGGGIALDAVFTGGIGTLAGVALSAADGLLLDKLARGWKPNQFIEQDLRPLLQDKR